MKPAKKKVLLYLMQISFLFLIYELPSPIKYRAAVLKHNGGWNQSDSFNLCRLVILHNISLLLNMRTVTTSIVDAFSHSLKPLILPQQKWNAGLSKLVM